MEKCSDFQRFFKENIISINEINHGGNNHLFRVNFSENSVLLKVYSARSAKHLSRGKELNRGKNEFEALSYLWNKGFREIPRPIKFFESDSVAIYSFEPGEILDDRQVGEKDICAASDFLVKLHKLPLEDRVNFGLATSACLSVSDYLAVLDSRISKIIDYSPIDEEGMHAREFLDKKVIPKAEELKSQTLKKVSNPDVSLSVDKQVLTPADYGFHNILFDGKKYVFLDFEYFGRDDPARQILDFLHHDKSAGITPELKSAFLERYMGHMNIPGFQQRIEILDPLVGMVWTLIYLNVLSKDYLSHVSLGSEEIEARVKKARNKLEDLRYFK